MAATATRRRTAPPSTQAPALMRFTLRTRPDFLEPPLLRSRLALAGDKDSEAVQFLCRSRGEAIRLAAGWLTAALGLPGEAWELDLE